MISRNSLERHRHRCHRNLPSRHQNQHHHLSLKATQSGQGGSVALVLSEFPICPLSNLDSVFVVVKRKPLTEVPRLYRWLARWVYFRIGWASDYCTELIGVYTSKSDAWHVANGPGLAIMEVPLNASLPDETCQFRCHEFPATDTEGRTRYQHRTLDLVAIPREHLMQLVAATEHSTGNGHHQ